MMASGDARTPPGRGGIYQDGFDHDALGMPVLVCRWRLAGGRLPLANRHLRALRSREIAGQLVPTPLVAWAKEHIELTLETGARDNPDGVLLLVVDAHMHAAMAVGPYQAPSSTTLRSLVRRARSAQLEAERTSVAPETLWLVGEEGLVWMDDRTHVASGAATLVLDMARTLGRGVERMEYGREANLPERLSRHDVFFVSDEHGVVLPSDRTGEGGRRYVEGYRKLLRGVARRQQLRDATGR